MAAPSSPTINAIGTLHTSGVKMSTPIAAQGPTFASSSSIPIRPAGHHEIQRPDEPTRRQSTGMRRGHDSSPTLRGGGRDATGRREGAKGDRAAAGRTLSSPAT